MAWADQHGLGTRLASLPLVLCGPILGRTEPDSVTVWVALKEARTVTLRVFERTPPPAPSSLGERAIGTRRTIALGDSLHLVAVTARPQAAPLEPGQMFFYDLFFGAGAASQPVPDTADALRTPGIVDPPGGGTLDDLEPTNLSYSQEHELPSFALPPLDLNKLRLVNGSCRRPHAQGLDALPVLDEILAVDWPVADERPHQLLLTGDQVYADDTAAALLFLLIDAASALLGWEEPLPGNPPPAELAPGKRKRVLKEIAGMTTEDAESHMIRLADFVGLHLFGWSHVFWPATFPEFEDVFPGHKREVVTPNGPKKTKEWSGYEGARPRLEEFASTLRQVRRALANVPTYMLFDDHDVTDDWNMYRDWIERVYTKPLGRRIVQNGLAAYALCQAWTSMPERFEPGQPGAALLEAIASWAATRGVSPVDEQNIGRHVGIPPLPAGGGVAGLLEAVEDGDRLARQPGALDWHYTVRGPKHELLALDSRTRRTYPNGKVDPPAQIGMASLREQIPMQAVPQDALTMIVATTNVLTIPWFQGRAFYGDKRISELLRYWYLALFRDWIFVWFVLKTYDPDLSDSWEVHSFPFEAILARLARRAHATDSLRTSRVIVLSGDVHMSWAGRLHYWAERPFQEDDDQPAPPGPEPPPVESVFAFLTSSGFKMAINTMSRLLHPWGYVPMADELPEPAKWLGWRRPAALGVSDQDVGRLADWAEYEPWMLRQTPPMLGLKDADDVFTPRRPDWRYRIDFMLGEKLGTDFSLSTLTNPDPQAHDDWLDVFNEALERHRDYAQKWGDGLEIIGRNNVAVLRFHWEGTSTLAGAITADAATLRLADSTQFPDPPFRLKIDGETLEVGELDRVTHVCSKLKRGVFETAKQAHQDGAAATVAKAAVQQHWWRLTNETRLQPLTTYTVSLEYDDARYPRPRLPQEPNP